MEVREIKEQIMNNTLDNFYIFTGDEIQAQRVYINKIAEVKGLIRRDIDSLSEISSTRATSLFSKNYCYVCRDDKEFMKSEKSWQGLSDLLGKNTLIFIVSTLDKRGKFYKNFADRIVTFDYFNVPTLTRYIQKEIKLDGHSCMDLIDICEQDYSRILLEINKIKIFAETNNLEYDRALQKLVKCGVIHIPPTDAIFNFTSAVMGHKVGLSYDLLDDCIRIGEPALRLITVLYTNFKHLLQVQSCQSKDIASSTGLSDWEIKCVKEYCGVYSTGDLVYILRTLEYAEKGIKTGQLDDDNAIDYCLVNIL